MSESIIYQVQPKEVDVSGQETLLDQYEIQTTVTTGPAGMVVSSIKTKQEFVLTTTTLYTLPSTTGHHLVEFQADNDVNVLITTTSGGFVEFGSVRNMIINFTTAVTNTYQLRNVSGTTSVNIVWREYV